MLLDFAKASSQVEMSSMIKAASDICHQDSRNAVLLRYPVKYSAQTTAAHLNSIRVIEDKVRVCWEFNIMGQRLNFPLCFFHIIMGPRGACQWDEF